MSTGLLALLDDVAAIAKVAAASLDDAATQAAKAGSKAAGIVIDDAAVTPRYVVGLSADRELPIIARIAWGSLRNKLLFLLPGALLLNFLAPWIITPLLMLGGAFLCLEGWEKVADFVRPRAHAKEPDAEPVATSLAAFEDARVASAVRTDFILSAEIMAITLSVVADAPLWLEAAVLGVVGLSMTTLVYGAVAGIVKADDAGVALARHENGALAALGRGIVVGMPHFLRALGFVGMIAMLWVGGGILVHGLHGLGWSAPETTLHHVAEASASAAPFAAGFVGWIVQAGIAACIGLAVGAIAAPIAHHAIAPAFAKLKGALGR